MRKLPKQKPRRSEQVVRTPPAFLEAVAERFGPIGWDLAATRENKVATYWLGPGSPHGEDALAVDWAMLPVPRGTTMFCNPPHGESKRWVEKAAEMRSAILGTAVLLLPAAVGTTWFMRHVHGKALVVPINPRLTFVGQMAPYPKDLMICAYGRWIVPAFAPWRWVEDCPF